MHRDTVSLAVAPIRKNFDKVQMIKPRDKINERVLLQTVDRLVKTDEGNEWRICETRLGIFTTKIQCQEIIAESAFWERIVLLQLDVLLHRLFTQDYGLHVLISF